MSVLEQILARKRREVERWKTRAEALLSSGEVQHKPLDVPALLRKAPGAAAHVIAEIKFRSPSAGVIRRHDTGAVVNIARAYCDGGATMLSVLADGPGFGGSIANVARVRNAVSSPILFKEFVLDAVQLDLARWAGADAVLLLVNALSRDALHELVEGCRSRALWPLVEAANQRELEAALETSAALVGINARDLHTFSVDPTQADHLSAQIPTDRVAVTMSGVRDKARFEQVSSSRADAVLIGEGLMRAADPTAVLRSWRGKLRRGT